MRRNLYLQKILVTLFAAGMMQLSAISADAQNWALPSSQWIYKTTSCDYQAHCSDGVSTIVTVRDTLTLGNRSCSRLSYYFGNMAENVYTYSSADTAYLYADSTWWPMFYFDALQGDTLVIHTMSNNQHQSGKVVVDSIGWLITRHDTLRKVSVTVVNRNTVHFSYAEKIGLLGCAGPVFLPALTQPVDADCTYICNYGDSTIMEYNVFPDSNCRSVFTGIEDGGASVKVVHCYPSPSTGLFTIDLPMLGSKTLHIYDAVGRLVWERSFESMSETVHLSTAGTYIVEVTAGDIRYRRRLVVE